MWPFRRTKILYTELVMDIVKNKSKTVGFNVTQDESDDVNIINVEFAMDLSDVASYRPSLNKDGEEEDYTIVNTKDAGQLCINMHFDDFDHIYTKYVRPKKIFANLSDFEL